MQTKPKWKVLVMELTTRVVGVNSKGETHAYTYNVRVEFTGEEPHDYLSREAVAAWVKLAGDWAGNSKA